MDEDETVEPAAQEGEDIKREDESIEDMKLPQQLDQVHLGSSLDVAACQEAWMKYDTAVHDLALGLTEQLRLILEPTQATRFRGDYKTGKRLNMKRIIPYIASQFKKDKIWLRRTKPSKRQYQIMIAVDDSKSMSESRAVDLAFESIALVSKALTQLDAGQLAITRFGSDFEVVHQFDQPFSMEAGTEVVRSFGFQQDVTDVLKLVQSSIDMFTEARALGNQDLWQLQIVISDGICEDHASLRRMIRRAQLERIMIVFVVVDGIGKSGSILDMNQVRYATDESGNMSVKIDRYLDTFPFDFYVIVRNINELPGVLSSVLRQYFATVSNM